MEMRTRKKITFLISHFSISYSFFWPHHLLNDHFNLQISSAFSQKSTFTLFPQNYVIAESLLPTDTNTVPFRPNVLYMLEVQEAFTSTLSLKLTLHIWENWRPQRLRTRFIKHLRSTDICLGKQFASQFYRWGNWIPGRFVKFLLRSHNKWQSKDSGLGEIPALIPVSPGRGAHTF